MYVRKNDLTYTVRDNQSYIGEDGTKYPRNYPKDEITELAQVTETDKPEADVITGYYIDETYTQVWQGRAFTQEELMQQKQALLVSEILALEAQITQRRLREALISGDYSFINDIEAQIAVRRAEIN